ncbi:MAG: DNA alkylation repair protein [Actinomycetota bacterium]
MSDRLAEAMAALEAAGTAQNRKVYARHGASDPMFGVSYGDLGTLAKRFRGDHELAVALFATGNHDARQLAAKLTDPARMTVKLANDWARAIDCYITAEAVAGVVANSPHARGRSDQWRDKKAEWLASAGWGIVAYTAEHDIWTVADLRTLLTQIEAEIHDRPNRVRHEMNQAVITIGLRSPALRKSAIATARRIGPVVVDHGETNCKTPEAIGYIEKTVAHREAQAAKKAANAAAR